MTRLASNFIIFTVGVFCCWHICVLFILWSFIHRLFFYLLLNVQDLDMIRTWLKAAVRAVTLFRDGEDTFAYGTFHCLQYVCFLWYRCMHFKSHGWGKRYSKQFCVLPWFLVMIIHLCLMLYVLLSKCELLCWKKNWK